MNFCLPFEFDMVSEPIASSKYFTCKALVVKGKFDNVIIHITAIGWLSGLQNYGDSIGRFDWEFNAC